MANNENLQKFTKENAKEYGKRGGVKSGQVRAERKTMKKQLETLLSLPITDEKKIDKLLQMGFSEDELNNQAFLIYTLFEKAISGDTRSINLILQTMSKEDEEMSNKFNDELNGLFQF